MLVLMWGRRPIFVIVDTYIISYFIIKRVNHFINYFYSHRNNLLFDFLAMLEWIHIIF